METVTKLYNSGEQTWELIKANHEKIKGFENILTTEYSNELKAAKTNIAKIQQFVAKCYPDILIGKSIVELGSEQEIEDKTKEEDKPSKVPTATTQAALCVPETPGPSTSGINRSRDRSQLKY